MRALSLIVNVFILPPNPLLQQAAEPGDEAGCLRTHRPRKSILLGVQLRADPSALPRKTERKKQSERRPRVFAV